MYIFQRILSLYHANELIVSHKNIHTITYKEIHLF